MPYTPASTQNEIVTYKLQVSPYNIRNNEANFLISVMIHMPPFTSSYKHDLLMSLDLVQEIFFFDYFSLKTSENI